MHPLAYVALLSVIFLGLSAKQMGESVRKVEAELQTHTASAMAVVASSAGDYARSHTTTNGAVTAATVGVPTWLNVPAGVGIVLWGGKSYVYKAGSSKGQAIGVALACRQGVTCAVTSGGSMVDVRDQTLLGAAPAGIPADNAAVLIY